jgi:hypothetical protein
VEHPQPVEQPDPVTGAASTGKRRGRLPLRRLLRGTSAPGPEVCDGAVGPGVLFNQDIGRRQVQVE